MTVAGLGGHVSAEMKISNRRLARTLLACGALFIAPQASAAQPNTVTFSMEQVLAYPFVPELDAA
jgi:hypothetical protein